MLFESIFWMRLYSDCGYLLAMRLLDACDDESVDCSDAFDVSCGLGGGGGGGSFMSATRRGAARGMVAQWGGETPPPP